MYYSNRHKHRSNKLNILVIFTVIILIAIIYFILIYPSRPLSLPSQPVSSPTSTPSSKISRSNLSVTSHPRADYIITLTDKKRLKGRTPFKKKINTGNLNIELSAPGYNTLRENIPLEKNTKKTYYLDPSGQLVHHLFNITNVPSPKGVAFSPDGKEIWITRLLNKKKGLSVFDAQTGKKITDVNLDSGGGVEVIFSQNGQFAYVSQMEIAKVYEISTETKKVTRTFATGSAWTKILALSSDGKTLYASNWSGNDVSQIDLKTGKLIQRFPTVETPRGLYITKNNQYLYVAGFDKGEIQKINLFSGKSKIVYTSGGAMRHIIPDENKNILYLSDMAKDAIFKLNLLNDSVIKFTATDHNPNTIALSPDKKVLFVSCRGKNATADNYYIPGPEWGSVLLFDTATGKMLDAIIGGNQPTALDISLDGKKMIFSDFLDGVLEVFSIPDYATLASGGGGRSSIYKKELMK